MKGYNDVLTASKLNVDSKHAKSCHLLNDAHIPQHFGLLRRSRSYWLDRVKQSPTVSISDLQAAFSE